MKIKAEFASCNKGSVLVLVAVMLPLFVLLMTAAIDLSRLYTVRGKAQAACDAALLGAVSTRSSISVASETTALFNANYPQNYLGSTATAITVSEPGDGVYTASLTVTLPTIVLGIFSNNMYSIAITSEATVGYQATPGQSLELALAVDNSNTMSSNLTAVQQNAAALTKILFGQSTSLSNVHISVVPFDVDVNAGSGHDAWIQSAWVSIYDTYYTQAGGGNGFIANRNADNPPNDINDVSDAAPTSDETRFRVPYTYDGGSGDTVEPMLAPAVFGMNSVGAVTSALSAMAGSGDTRINVGLMWGWFMLSPNWAGLWNSGQPGLPAAFGTGVNKQMVLVVGSLNNVYTGGDTSNDDTTTAGLCAAIQAEGITLYVIGIGSNINATLLQSCASLPAYYFPVSTVAQMQNAFAVIADDIDGATLRLGN